MRRLGRELGGLVGRRQAITLAGGAAILAAESGYLTARHVTAIPAAAAAGLARPPDAYAPGASYAPDGTAGRRVAVPMARVRLGEGPFHVNEGRNLDYLLFLDPDRMLRSFRLNYGLPTTAMALGGWEQPDSLIRGHTTGHLMTALAFAYAGTGTSASDPARRAVRAKGDYLVSELGGLQARASLAGYHRGYLSAFPEVFFDWLETGQWSRIWSPYYMIHKYLAGLIDQYQLAGNARALDVATQLGDWVNWRTARLSPARMQAILEVEFGGMPEALANLYAITGEPRYLAAAERFWHARFLDPLAAGVDDLAGEQCNISTPKVVAAVRLWEETGNPRYFSAARNFWDFATGSHSYAIGGQGNHEHWGPPGVVAAALSNYNCEGCVSYNMLKLTRLLHFHAPGDAPLADYYERTLFNHLLGQQDPSSPHGLVCYYTGLSQGAHKQQPLNYFPGGSTAVFGTDYATFTCDTATGLETPARFSTAIYTLDPDGLRVDQFISSTVSAFGLTVRQDSGIPDAGHTTLTVTGGSARAAIRVRAPAWAVAAAAVRLNGVPLGTTATSSSPEIRYLPAAAGSSSYLEVSRDWRAGDELTVSFRMAVGLAPAPDDPTVAAVTYGPVVLAGLTGPGSFGGLPRLDVASVRRVVSSSLAFQGRAGFPGESGWREVPLIPVSRVAHQHYTVYWRTS